MFRRYAMAALTLLAVACGDDEPAKDDAAVAVDAGQAPVAGKVTNTGAACAAPTACTGSAASCLTSQPLMGGGSITFEGGYCSTQCIADTECSDGTSTAGKCPLHTLVDGSNTLTSMFTSFLKPLSVCLKTCVTDADCRGTGYKCDLISSQVMSFLPPAAASFAPIITGGLDTLNKYCLSTNIILPVPDAGVATDGGATDGGATDAGSTDGGATDGGATDAGSTDGGATDGGATDAGTDAGRDAA